MRGLENSLKMLEFQRFQHMRGMWEPQHLQESERATRYVGFLKITKANYIG